MQQVVEVFHALRLGSLTAAQAATRLSRLAGEVCDGYWLGREGHHLGVVSSVGDNP